MRASPAAHSRVPCAVHACSPLHLSSPAVPNRHAKAPYLIHEFTTSEDDDHDHDPLYFDPRRRPQPRKHDERALMKKRELQKQYDSHAHERVFRDQGADDRDGAPKLYEVPRGHPLLLPKPPPTARLVQPVAAAPSASARVSTAAPPARSLPPPTSRQLVTSHPRPIAAGPSVSRTKHKGRQEPRPTPSARQGDSKVHVVPATAARPSASASSTRGVIGDGRAKLQMGPPMLKTTAGARSDAALVGMLGSESTLSNILPPKKAKKKHHKKRKKKRRSSESVIIVSTPSGPFSPGTRQVLKSRKALKKAREMWHATQYAGACCLFADILFTFLILGAVIYWLWPSTGEDQPGEQSGYSENPDQYIAPALFMNFLHGQVAQNNTAFLR